MGVWPVWASINGFEGMAAGFRLITRCLRKDMRFDVLVWDGAEFPFGGPRYREVVASRTQARVRIQELVAEIEAGDIPSDPGGRPGPSR